MTPPPTRLVLPVDELADVLPGAHIALLDPFLPADQLDAGVLAELRDLFAEVVPFAFRLGEPARFPSGAAYLPPQPVTVLRRIMHDLRRTFPELAVEGTAISGAMPHLTVPDDALGTIATPLEVHGREAQLLEGAGAGSRVLEVFPFGTSAA